MIYIGLIVRLQRHTKVFRYITVNRESFLKRTLTYLYWTKYNEINVCYSDLYGEKTWFEATQLEKARFIKMNELKITQVELLWFFHFNCVVANVSELFCMTHSPNNE